MMTYGIDSAGFTIKPLTAIRQEVNTLLQSKFGNQINLSDESVFGQLSSVFAERESVLWELIEDLYNSQYPDGASYAALDNVCSLNNVTRLGASATKITGQIFYSSSGGVTVPEGTILSVANNTDIKFTTDTALTTTSGTDTIQTITFSPTPDTGTYYITLDGDTTTTLSYSATDTQLATALNNLSALSTTTVTGSYTSSFTVTFTGADGSQDQSLMSVSTSLLQSGTAALTVTAVVTETQTGTLPQGTVNCTCTTLGANVVNANTVTVIDTAITNINSTTNPSDATTITMTAIPTA